jgi:fructose-bisphosphate aldolase class 1
MQVEILERDIEAGTIKMRFSHNNITHTDNYNLKMVVPGTDRILAEYGMLFDETMQQRVIQKVTEQVQRDIEAGIIHNPI